MPSPRQAALFGGGFSPYTLADNAAVYSLSGSASDSTYLIDGSNRLYYVADRSGNSAVNGLILPGTSGNYASFAAISAPRTGAFSVSVKLTVASLSATGVAIGGPGNAFSLRVLVTTGQLQAFLNTVSSVAASTGTVTALTEAVIGYTRTGTTGTYYINGVAAGVVTDSTDYTQGISEVGSILGGTINLVPGFWKWARVYSVALDTAAMLADANGTVQANSILNIDFTAQAKLATSFTATVGGTVTVNQTAIALPARIHGARDLYQGVQANQPIFSVSDGYNIATFDGSNDYLKSAAFSYSQPESVYFVGSQATWTSADYIYDGNGNAVMVLQQQTGTPQLNIYAGTYVGTTSPAIGSKFVDAAVFNGASSSHRLNKDAAVTGSCGVQNGSGFTLGSPGSGSSNFGNFTFSEALLRTGADADAMQLRIAGYAIRKWGITG